MIVLGIDTCSDTASAALCSEEKVIAEFSFSTRNTHSQVILPLVRDMLDRTGLTFENVDGFAAITGPGSYTGLRIGISSVKGICFALGKKCCGVSALEALAYNIQGDGVICALMHARADLMYAAFFRGCERLTEDRIVSAEELSRQIAGFGEKVICVGDCGKMTLPGNAVAASPVHSRRSAASMCFAAMAHGFDTPDKLMPDYLQVTKAEKDLAEK